MRLFSNSGRGQSVQRWLTITGFIVLGGYAVYQFWLYKHQSGTVSQAGLAISLMLGLASILGIVMSFIIFRTPHDGTTEL